MLRSAPTFVVAAATFALSVIATVAGCKPPVATPQECDAVAGVLADLQVKKEKTPPFGQLVPPFNDPEHEKDIREEAKKRAKERCDKGWKRAVYECMMKAPDLGAADKCRNE